MTRDCKQLNSQAMNRTRFIARSLGVAFAVMSAAALGGCGEDVGSCKGELGGRDTVVVGSSLQVQYAGQAILNQSCANQVCHASSATGANRHGAPAGLDFDLKPVVGIDEEDENEYGTVIGRVDAAELAELRARQSAIVDQRDIIWQQVKDGHMPPDGMWAGLRKLMNVRDTPESKPCTKEAAFEPIDTPATQEVLRNWLACGAPFVEAGTDLVTKREPGTVGYQYPMCGGDELKGNTIEAVQARVFDNCAGCHSESNDTDLSSADASYAALVEDDAEVCNDKPFVTKGDARQSYLYDLISEDDPGCHPRMPLAMDPLPEEDIELVKAWIDEGAKREGE